MSNLFSCGSCGYPLNLTSSNRITSSIASKYRKSINKGSISFLSIDPSRFTQVDEVKCLPIAWGRYHSKSKLLCRNCGVLIGHGYGDSTALCGLESPSSSSSSYKKIIVKIRALQPSDTAAVNGEWPNRPIHIYPPTSWWLLVLNFFRRSTLVLTMNLSDWLAIDGFIFRIQAVDLYNFNAPLLYRAVPRNLSRRSTSYQHLPSAQVAQPLPSSAVIVPYLGAPSSQIQVYPCWLITGWSCEFRI